MSSMTVKEMKKQLKAILGVLATQRLSPSERASIMKDVMKIERAIALPRKPAPHREEQPEAPHQEEQPKPEPSPSVKKPAPRAKKAKRSKSNRTQPEEVLLLTSEDMVHNTQVVTQKTRTPSQLAHGFEHSRYVAVAPIYQEGEKPLAYFTRLSHLIHNIYHYFDSKPNKTPTQNITFFIGGTQVPFSTGKIWPLKFTELTPENLLNLFEELLLGTSKSSDGRYQEYVYELSDSKDFAKVMDYFTFMVGPVPFVHKGGSDRTSAVTKTLKHPAISRGLVLKGFDSKDNNCFFQCLVKSPQNGGFGEFDQIGRYYMKVKEEYGLRKDSMISVKIANRIVQDRCINKSIIVKEYAELTQELIDSAPNLIVLLASHYYVFRGYADACTEEVRYCEMCHSTYLKEEAHLKTCADFKQYLIETYGPDYLNGYIASTGKTRDQLAEQQAKKRADKPKKYEYVSFEDMIIRELRKKYQNMLIGDLKPDHPHAVFCCCCRRHRHESQFDASGVHKNCRAFEIPLNDPVERICAVLDSETRASLTSKCHLIETALFAVKSKVDRLQADPKTIPSILASAQEELTQLENSKMHKTVYTHLAIVHKCDGKNSLPKWDRANDPDMLRANIQKVIFEHSPTLHNPREREDYLIEQFLEWLIKEQKAGRYYMFWAHRGGSFDYIPIVGYLYRNLDKYRAWFRPTVSARIKGSKQQKSSCIMLRGTRVLEFKFGLHVFKDSYNFVASKLSVACNDKNFAVTPEFRKIENFVHDDGILPVDELMFFRPELDFQEYVHALRSNFVSVKGRPVSLDQLYTEYNVLDCVALLEIMLKVDEGLRMIVFNSKFHPGNDERSDSYVKVCQKAGKVSKYRQMFNKRHLPPQCEFGLDYALTLPGWAKKLFKWLCHRDHIYLPKDNPALRDLCDAVRKYGGKVGGVSAVNPNFQGYVHTDPTKPKLGIQVKSIAKCDVKGMYSAIMLHCMFPTGYCFTSETTLTHEDYIRNLDFFLVDSLTAPVFPPGVIHSRPLRDDKDGRLDWYADPSASEENPILYSGVALNQLKRDGYQFVSNKQWCWSSMPIGEDAETQSSRPQVNKVPMFRSFADLFVSKKYEQDVAIDLSSKEPAKYLELVHQGVIDAVNNAMRNMYKLGSNSLYGKTLEDITPIEFEVVEKENLSGWLSAQQAGDKLDMTFNGSSWLIKRKQANSFNPLLPMGVLILDYSKDMLFKYLDVFGRSNIAMIETDGFGVIDVDVKKTLAEAQQIWYEHKDRFKYEHARIAKSIGKEIQIGHMQFGEQPGELELEKELSAMYNLEKKMCLPIPKGCSLTPEELLNLPEHLDSFVISPEQQESYSKSLSGGTSKGVPKTQRITAGLFRDLYHFGLHTYHGIEFKRCAFSKDACLIQVESEKKIKASVAYA